MNSTNDEDGMHRNERLKDLWYAVARVHQGSSAAIDTSSC
jgi:hypothetical protein